MLIIENAFQFSFVVKYWGRGNDGVCSIVRYFSRGFERLIQEILSPDKTQDIKFPRGKSNRGDILLDYYNICRAHMSSFGDYF